MKKQILDYMKAIRKILDEDHPETDWKETAVQHLVKTEFYQHERMVHLIVMALFAVMEVVCVSTMLITSTATLSTRPYPHVTDTCFLSLRNSSNISTPAM